LGFTDKLDTSLPLVKVDEANQMTWGLVTAELPDKENDICDSAAANTAYRYWCNEPVAPTQGAGQPSLGRASAQARRASPATLRVDLMPGLDSSSGQQRTKPLDQLEATDGKRQ
jgi:hypothetical protein